MSNEQKFLRLAVAETIIPDRSDSKGCAEAAVIGAIEQNLVADTRDCFIKAGLAYIDLFDEYADTAIEAERDRDTFRDGERSASRQVILELRQLKKDSRLVRPDEFFEALAADWDERHEDDKDSRS
ncbi:MAG: hypothetical protein Q8M11_22205 [Sulfuritalea sp.]|nr:hypothetical protein [Sulfuritalea sp.]